MGLLTNKLRGVLHSSRQAQPHIVGKRPLSSGLTSRPFVNTTAQLERGRFVMAIDQEREKAAAQFEKLLMKYKGGLPGNFTGRSSVRALIWDKTAGHCWYCGKKTHPFRDFTIDHLLPISKGGKETYDNLAPCCRQCNGRKATITLERFRAKLGAESRKPIDFSQEQLQLLATQRVSPEMLGQLPITSKFIFYFEEKRDV